MMKAPNNVCDGCLNKPLCRYVDFVEKLISDIENRTRSEHSELPIDLSHISCKYRRSKGALKDEHI